MALVKKTKKQEDENPSVPSARYRVVNLVEAVYPVPVYNDEGKLEYLQIRIQARGGQTPPVIAQEAITEALLNLQKKGMLKLERVD